jgi:hypothetical protein
VGGDKLVALVGSYHPAFTLHLGKGVADSLGTDAADSSQLGDSDGYFGLAKHVVDLLCGGRGRGLRDWWTFEQAQADLALGCLEGHGKVGSSWGGAVLYGQGEVIVSALKIEVGVAPGVELRGAPKGLTGAEMMRLFSGVVNNGDGNFEQSLERTKVSQNRSDFRR